MDSKVIFADQQVAVVIVKVKSQRYRIEIICADGKVISRDADGFLRWVWDLKEIVPHVLKQPVVAWFELMEQKDDLSKAYRMLMFW